MEPKVIPVAKLPGKLPPLARAPPRAGCRAAPRAPGAPPRPALLATPPRAGGPPARPRATTPRPRPACIQTLNVHFTLHLLTIYKQQYYFTIIIVQNGITNKW